VLLDLSIILTLLVLWALPSLTRCQSGLKRRNLRALVGSYQNAWASPQEKVSAETPLLRRGGEDLLLQGPSALTNKLLIELSRELSRVALRRNLHERSVD
jgi:hypothetical protein